jgi:chemotaxis protein histidine kinase CheA
MLDFLERAGLVTKDVPVEPCATVELDASGATPAVAVPTLASNVSNTVLASAATAMPAEGALPLDLDAIYANGGIAPSLYPAERLLRLVDGLSAMDEATRLMAIKAMDAADESWCIEDPLADAAAKVKALATHAQQLQTRLQALEQDTQKNLDAIAIRKEQAVGDIRKQISELEALVSRASARAAQETALHQAQLQAAQNQTAQELSEITQVSQRLQGLALHFGALAITPQE